MRSCTKILVCLLVVLAVAPVSFAQLETASIVGTVFDTTGAVIPNVEVTVQHQGTAATVTLTTDANGNYVAPVLQTGGYRITASTASFKTHSVEGITLRAGDRIRVDLTLETGVVTETVTVTGEAPIVESASTTLGGVVGTQQITELPVNGRSLTQYLAVVPGAVFLGPQRSMNGASQGRLFEPGLVYMIDGADSSQVDSHLGDGGYQSAARISRASPDSIAEVRVVQSSFSAEYGTSNGAVINFLTKSGTNQFHGSVFEYFRNDKLDARNYFNPRPAVKPSFRLNQFGASFGGPIIRDRLFFFANYEGVRQRQGVVQNVFVPTAEYRATLNPTLRDVINQLPLPNGPASPSDPRIAQHIRGVSNQLTEDTGSVKVDYNASANDRISLRYNRNNSDTLAYFGVTPGQARVVPAALQTAKLSYTKTISATLLNEASFAINRPTWDLLAASDDATRFFPQVNIGGGTAAIGPQTNDLNVGNSSFTWLDTLSWVKGSHQMKIGAQVVRNRDNKQANYQRTITFLTLDAFAANTPFSITSRGNPTVGMRNTYYNFFFQDDIQVGQKLTINAGLRYQYDTTPSESKGRIANFDLVTGQLDPIGTPIFKAPKLNLGPRFGLAYTPFRGKPTVLRAGYAIAHASLIAAQPQSLPANLPGINQSASVTASTFPGLIGFPTPDITSFQGVTSYWSVHKDWKSSYTQSWTANIQQGLGQDTVLQVGYIGNHTVHLSPYRNVNPVIPGAGRRVYANLGAIQQFWPCCGSNYNALQTSLKRRFSKGFTFNINHTWSHSLDQGGLTFSSQAQNFDDYTTEYGHSDYDARHNLQIDYTYEIPAIPRIPKVIGSGWQINGITILRSGLPSTVFCGCDSSGKGTANSRADVVPGVDPIPANKGIPAVQFNIAAFRAPVPGSVGTVARNTVRGPAAYNSDFSLVKNFQVKEGHSLQFRAEVFNIFNTPQFNQPGTTLTAPATFGRSLSTISAIGGFGSQRQMQFALRYAF